MTEPATPPPRPTGTCWPLALGLTALLPFLLFYGSFRQLFWFGDEFPLMDEIDTQPFGHWVWTPFVENILPLFKLLWGNAVRHGSGAYITMLWGSWIVHLATTGLMAWWMRRAQFGWGSVMLMVIGFGWSASQIETLTWSVQVSAQLATCFFVAAAVLLPRAQAEAPGLAQILAMSLLSLASAWSFSRGLLTGPVLAGALVYPLSGSGRGKQWAAALCVLIPTVITGILMVKNSPADSRHLASDASHWGAVLKFALSYLAGNPFIPLRYSAGNGSPFEVKGLTVVAVGTLKLGVWACGWCWATPRQRRLLGPVLLLEFGYAALLGLGRWEGGWPYAMGSRYQYNSLLFTLPFAGIVLEGAAARLLAGSKFRAALIGIAISALGIYSLTSWYRAMPGWVEWRGLENRRWLVESPTIKEGFDLVAVPSFPNWRSKQLKDKYHLH